MTHHHFQQINVFSAAPYMGNPLAVIHNADTLSLNTMQQIARWCNLSETAFLLNPKHPHADYRVRIFTQNGTELAFAGHPTLGACHAWLQNGGKPHHPQHIVQECGAGLITIRQTGHTYRCFAAPELTHCDIPPEQLTHITRALNLKPQQIISSQRLSNTRHYHALKLDSAQSVLNAIPDLHALAQAQINLGIIGPYAPPLSQQPDTAQVNTPDFEVRYFAPAAGVSEDPITGNLNGALAQWLIATRQAPLNYTAAQGTILNRAGRVYIHHDPATQLTWVGGDTQTCTQGTITI